MQKTIIIITFLLNFVYSNKSKDSQYEFDFGFDKKDGSGREILIEVLKSTKNDAIFSAKDQEKCNHLEWMSIGDPQIYQPENRTFMPNSLGFTMEIQMLSKKDKQLIKQRIFEMHNIEVDINQIKRQELDHMDCTIQFEHTGDAYTLKGTVQDFDRNPLEVWFNYTSVSEEYLAFESILKEKNIEDLRVICQINSSIYNFSKNIKIDFTKNLTEKPESEDLEQDLEINKLKNQTENNLENQNDIKIRKLDDSLNDLKAQLNEFRSLFETRIDASLEDLKTRINEFRSLFVAKLDASLKDVKTQLNKIEDQFETKIKILDESLKNKTKRFDQFTNRTRSLNDWFQILRKVAGDNWEEQLSHGKLAVLQNGDLASVSNDGELTISDSSTGSLKITFNCWDYFGWKYCLDMKKIETISVLPNGYLASGNGCHDDNCIIRIWQNYSKNILDIPKISDYYNFLDKTNSYNNFLLRIIKIIFD
jgi:hypothetical protein